MATLPDIKNAALSELGEVGTVSALVVDNELVVDPDVRQAVDDIYPAVKNGLLYGYPWSWSLERRKLEGRMSEDEANPVVAANPALAQWRFKYRYPLLGSLPQIGQIRALYDRNDEFSEPRVSGWSREGDFIFARYDEVWLEYQRDLDEEAFPELFVSALIPTLASRLCQLVIEDTQAAQDFRRVAAEATRVARMVDSQSKPPEQIPRLAYIRARFGGFSGFSRRYHG